MGCDLCGTVLDAVGAVGGGAGMAREACSSQSIMGECMSVDQGVKEEVRSMAIWTRRGGMVWK